MNINDFVNIGIVQEILKYRIYHIQIVYLVINSKERYFKQVITISREYG